MFLKYPEMGNAGHVLCVLELSRTDVVSKRNIGGNMPEHNDLRAEEKWRKVTRKEWASRCHTQSQPITRCLEGVKVGARDVVVTGKGQRR